MQITLLRRVRNSFFFSSSCLTTTRPTNALIQSSGNVFYSIHLHPLHPSARMIVHNLAKLSRHTPGPESDTPKGSTRSNRCRGRVLLAAWGPSYFASTFSVSISRLLLQRPVCFHSNPEPSLQYLLVAPLSCRAFLMRVCQLCMLYGYKRGAATDIIHRDGSDLFYLSL